MIVCQGLTKTYRNGHRALAPLDLTVDQGVVGLLGPNGAGKTTLLSMLVLALEPSAGTREWFGLDDRPAHHATIRPWIGFLPQEMDLVAGLTGREVLYFAARLRQVDLTRHQLDRRITGLLAAVGLEQDGNRRADHYSGGMQRRLGTAMALVHRPRFLVVDEPTAGLDPEERLRFRALVTELGDRIPVLLSTHIVEDIEATCPRLVILEEGQAIFDDGPGVLFEATAGKVWRLPPDAADRQTDAPVIGRASDGERPCDVVWSAGPPAGFAGDEVTLLEPSLEQAYAAWLAASNARKVAA